MRLTAKERVLLHLLDFARHAESVEVPPEMAQEGVAGAVGIELRHLTQYIRPLEAEGLVRERRAHISGARQRRIVYDLTDTGRRAAMRLRDAVKSEVVRVRDAGGVREVTVARLLEESKGSASVVFISRQVAEAGIVELGALSRPGAPGLVEMLSDAPRIAKFVGREVELAAVTGTADGPRVFVVRGVAGIGKSSFAARACDLLRGRCNLFWHRLRPWDSRPSILARLGEFLSALGKPGLRSVLARGETARADPVLREDLPGTKSLLVFDDAHAANREVAGLLGDFLHPIDAPPATHKLLFLSRERAGFVRADDLAKGRVRELELSDLPGPDARAVLEALGAPASRREEIIDRGGGHPLSLELAAAGRFTVERARETSATWFAEEALSRLAIEPRRALELACVFEGTIPPEALGTHARIASSPRRRSRVRERTRRGNRRGHLAVARFRSRRDRLEGPSDPRQRRASLSVRAANDQSECARVAPPRARQGHVERRSPGAERQPCRLSVCTRTQRSIRHDRQSTGRHDRLRRRLAGDQRHRRRCPFGGHAAIGRCNEGSGRSRTGGISDRCSCRHRQSSSG